MHVTPKVRRKGWVEFVLKVPSACRRLAYHVATKRSLTVLPDDDIVTVDATSPDNTLTALAQLAAIRLNAQRAIVR